MAYDADFLRELYRRMVTIRNFELKVEELFFGGEIPGFVHLYIGEEAVGVGVCAALTNSDMITSHHRGHGHCIAKGAKVKPMMAEIFGKSTGYCKGKGGSMHIADFSIGMLGANGVVGGGYNLAVGAALAAKMRQSGQVAVCFFGDGASNRGTFHEAINMAAVWKLPVVFVCEMNEWASTTPCRTTTSVDNIADRAVSYGIPSKIVEGNDVFAVYEAAKEAIDRARQGGGPTLVEAKTYRVKGHYVGDPELYRTKEEVQTRFEKTDPLKNFANTVLKAGRLKQKDLDAIRDSVAREVEQAVIDARNDSYPADTELFNNLYIESGVR